LADQSQLERCPLPINSIHASAGVKTNSLVAPKGYTKGSDRCTTKIKVQNLFHQLVLNQHDRLIPEKKWFKRRALVQWFNLFP
jgi:hypothetical protein